jgi:hypothetical protein
MKRREILVFIAAFVVVLLGGAALAQVGTFGNAPDDEAAQLSAPAAPSGDQAVATTSEVATADQDETAPPELETTTSTTEPKDEEQPVAPPKDDEGPSDPPKDEPPSDVDETPPPLAILFPENEQHFKEDHIAFEGETEPGAHVFAGPYEADVDEEGNWRIVLILSPGGNLVTFTATDEAGNTSEASVKVFLDEDKDEPKTEFSAHQKWEVVDGSPATNVYYGTAAPGTKIWVGSQFGEGSTEANDGGEWELKVKFPEAPCNESFKVVVESNAGHRKEFRMKYVCATYDFTVHQTHGENTEPWTKFYGTGSPGTTVWIGSEYGSVETHVESNGEWAATLHFNDDLPANKEIKVVVEGEGGRAEFGFYWVVEDAVHVEFTANQKFGSCGEAVPYDIFWGTATPGATIWVESPYGGGTTTAGEAGKWDIQVEFPEAPVGESFTVVIESSDGGRATFSFVRTGEGEL